MKIAGLWSKRQFRIVDSIGYEESMGRVRSSEIGGCGLRFWFILLPLLGGYKVIHDTLCPLF